MAAVVRRNIALAGKKSESLLVFTYQKVDKPASSSSSKIASFDMDGTIITTKSGKLPFRTPPDDWKFLFKCVPEKLKSLHHEGYQIVLFTNQAGMVHGKPPLESFQLKIQAVAEALHCVPFTLVATLRDDLYRKPCTGMWQYFLKHEHVCHSDVNLEKCFYVGDAAGRAENWKFGEYTATDVSTQAFVLCMLLQGLRRTLPAVIASLLLMLTYPSTHLKSSS